MAGREVKDFTNLSDPKDKKWGSKGGKDKADDEDLAFKRMVAKMQEVAGERGGYLHGRGALDSDDLLYLKEQMEAEEDAERLRRRTEKRAFVAFKKAASLVDSASISTLPAIRVEPKPRSGIRYGSRVSLTEEHKAASLVDSAPISTLPALRVEPKPRSGIRQQVLVKSIVKVKAERPSSTLDSGKSSTSSQDSYPQSNADTQSQDLARTADTTKAQGGLLGLTYESEDDDSDEDTPAAKRPKDERDE